MKNTIREFLEKRGITRYRFHKDVGISPKTAYDLYANPDQLPASTVLAKICDTYGVQPGEVLVWLAPDERKSSDRPNPDEATNGGNADE